VLAACCKSVLKPLATILQLPGPAGLAYHKKAADHLSSPSADMSSTTTSQLMAAGLLMLPTLSPSSLRPTKSILRLACVSHAMNCNSKTQRTSLNVCVGSVRGTTLVDCRSPASQLLTLTAGDNQHRHQMSLRSSAAASVIATACQANSTTSQSTTRHAMLFNALSTQWAALIVCKPCVSYAPASGPQSLLLFPAEATLLRAPTPATWHMRESVLST
jgi:hypothetical protein